MVMESPGAGKAAYTAAGDTRTSFRPNTRKQITQGPTQTWALGRCWMTVAKGGGRRRAGHRLLLSLAAPAHMSHVSTGYLLPALPLRAG